MPGLSQLKQFNKDLLSLGDEITIRASRGEKPVAVSIPKEVKDVNDSEEFVLGMPQIEAEVAAPVDEDLSDLANLGGTSTSSSENSADSTTGFEAPDLSSLLNPINVPDDASAGAEMPDLSMFEEPEEQEEEVVEEKPEEISIADMGLDALLSGGGFDAPEDNSEPEAEPEPESPAFSNDFTEINDIDEMPEEPEAPSKKDDGLSELERDMLASMGLDSGSNSEPESQSAKAAEPGLDDLLAGLDSGDNNSQENTEPLEDLTEEPLEDLGEIPLDEAEPAEDAAPAEEAAPADDFNLDDLAAPAEENAVPAEDFNLDDLSAPLDDLGSAADFGEIPLDEAEPAEDAAPVEEAAPADDFNLDDLAAPAEENAAPAEDFNLDDLSAPLDDLGSAADFGDIPLDEAAPTEDAAPAEEAAPADDFNLDDLAAPAAEDAAPAEDFNLDNLAAPGDFNLDDMDMPAEAAETEAEPESPSAAEDNPEEEKPAAEDSGINDFSLDDMDFGNGEAAAPVNFDDEEIPDYEDSAVADSDADSENSDENPEGENAPLEVFDTSEMDGMDFGIPDTDSQLDGGNGSGGDFELGNNDDFAMEGEFEIPGFSDVETAKDGSHSGPKKKNNKELDEPDFSDAEESENLPPNTLSDAQYKEFLKNLSEYPLNVRLAFEDLIVQDEFTDDAEFEVIEKILNKAPARQVASMLEKMLDTSIPVPRDYEHRSAEEYEAYKKSLGYQLKNKIIPAILVGIVAILVGWGIFNFSKNCIYKPLKANKLYKQGYALLEADEYPQSEMKFEEAVSYRINKKWFFNYARGYREHKQYQRAGSMYERILKYFKHEKAAGLEYADMEVNDLANYERAEEIIRREVLDYHINDQDGILALGDVFLEWGTEKDPAKLENAREQYATLIQLYGSTDLYLSRMMRYFIRTDNLRNVIQMQKVFEPKEKSLCAEDWAELSGYLLDKYYGALAPSDEYLRYEIEGLRALLLRAVKTGPDNPIALYNLAKYFIQSGETSGIEDTLQRAIEKFNTVQSMKKRDVYKYIDAYRLLGEHYIDTTDYLQAQEQFAEGISLYTTERDNAGFEGNADIGKLYEDMGNIKYSISGDYDDALMNYKYSVELENDSPSIRYRIGYIQYKNKNYMEALGSFMKAGDGNVKERNLLLAMANTLSLRGDDYAAEGYYNQLIDSLDLEIAKRGVVFPQASVKDYDVVNTYLSAANNYGVTLYRLAKRTGNSGLNAKAIVQFQQSLRAWDALTRNQETLVRLSGSNLAEQNIQYITHPIPEFEPSIYTDIAKTLLDNEHF